MIDLRYAMSSLLAGLALAAFSGAAAAQETRNYTGTVLAGQVLQFDHWLNYQESTCKDRGFVAISLRSQPKLGRVTMQRLKVRSSSGACAGVPLSVVNVIYKAGRVPGSDVFGYGVRGAESITVNATVTVN